MRALQFKRLVSYGLISLFLVSSGVAQDGKKRKKDDGDSGKIEKLTDSLSKKKKKKSRDRARFLGFIDPVTVVELLASRDMATYPYSDNKPVLFEPNPGPGGVMRMQANYFYHNSSLQGLYWRYLYETDRFGFETDLQNLFEDTPSGTETLNFNGVRGSWAFLRDPAIRVRGLLGFLSLYGDDSFFSGPEIGLALTGLPGNHLIIEAEGRVARLDGSALTHGSASVGIMISRVQLTLGGHFIRTDAVTIDGMQYGLRFWF